MRTVCAGLPPFLLVGIGTSIVALLAAIAHFSLSRKGLLLQNLIFLSHIWMLVVCVKWVKCSGMGLNWVQ